MAEYELPCTLVIGPAKWHEPGQYSADGKRFEGCNMHVTYKGVTMQKEVLADGVVLTSSDYAREAWAAMDEIDNLIEYMTPESKS